MLWRWQSWYDRPTTTTMEHGTNWKYQSWLWTTGMSRLSLFCCSFLFLFCSFLPRGFWVHSQKCRLSSDFSSSTSSPFPHSNEWQPTTAQTASSSVVWDDDSAARDRARYTSGGGDRTRRDFYDQCTIPRTHAQWSFPPSSTPLTGMEHQWYIRSRTQRITEHEQTWRTKLGTNQRQHR